MAAVVSDGLWNPPTMAQHDGETEYEDLVAQEPCRSARHSFHLLEDFPDGWGSEAFRIMWASDAG